jgi:hypothetical protein
MAANVTKNRKFYQKIKSVTAIKPLQDFVLTLLYVLYLVTVDMLIGLPGHQSRLRESDTRMVKG